MFIAQNKWIFFWEHSNTIVILLKIKGLKTTFYLTSVLSAENALENLMLKKSTPAPIAVAL